MQDWYVYMLRCADGSLYTGITRDLQRRIAEHNHDNRLGAAYTRARRPAVLVYQEQHPTRSLAQKREYEIRRLGKARKESLVSACQASAGLTPVIQSNS